MRLLYRLYVMAIFVQRTHTNTHTRETTRRNLTLSLYYHRSTTKIVSRGETFNEIIVQITCNDNICITYAYDWITIMKHLLYKKSVTVIIIYLNSGEWMYRAMNTMFGVWNTDSIICVLVFVLAAGLHYRFDDGHFRVMCLKMMQTIEFSWSWTYPRFYFLFFSSLYQCWLNWRKYVGGG